MIIAQNVTLLPQSSGGLFSRLFKLFKCCFWNISNYPWLRYLGQIIKILKICDPLNYRLIWQKTSYLGNYWYYHLFASPVSSDQWPLCLRIFVRFAHFMIGKFDLGCDIRDIPIVLPTFLLYLTTFPFCSFNLVRSSSAIHQVSMKPWEL